MESVDFQVTYPWLTKKLFQGIIEKEFPENVVKTENFAINAALAKGENFGSQMLRAIVSYTMDDKEVIHEKRFIIKAPVIDLNVRAYLAALKIAEKEISSFKYILPEVYRLLEKIDDYTKMSAKCYETSVEHSYIIFEDLTARNYANSDKKNGLTVKHYELVLKKLAKWHAVNAAQWDEITF